MIKNLILSGGAFMCCSHIGCIKYLEEHDAMKHITTFIGTSAGSIVSTLLAIGMTSEEMRAAINELIALQSECPPDIDSILNVYYTMGVSDGAIIKIFINRMIDKKLKRPHSSPPITFIELAKATGRNLIVYSAKLPTLENTFFSVDTTPDLDIATAVRASCSVPFLFTPTVINKQTYIDSGLTDNFPFDYVKNNRLKDTLGIRICGSRELKMPKQLNLLTYLTTVFSAMMRQLNNSHGPDPPSMTVIDIFQENANGFELNFDMSTCQFNISDEKVRQFIDYGYETITKYYEAQSK